MGDDRKDWSAVILEPGAELIVGWRPRPSRLDAAAVELSGEVAEEIRSLCRGTLDLLGGLIPRPYGASPYIERDEEYLAVPVTELAGADGAQPGQSDDDEAAGLSDLQRLVATAGLRPISRAELREGRYLFYAAICAAAGSGQRLGFVRQSDPHRVAKAGGFLALLGQEGLQHLDDPVFVLEAGFDLVVAPEEIAVLRVEAFNRMFADLHTLASAAPANAKLIAEVMPRMRPAAVEALGGAAAARPSLARRLARLARPGAVPAVTPDDLSAAMSKHGLDPGDLVSDGEIAFEANRAAVFLDLIEQLYYETDFTGEHRRSDRYSPIQR
jgi:hypothetical protein